MAAVDSETENCLAHVVSENVDEETLRRKMVAVSCRWRLLLVAVLCCWTRALVGDPPARGIFNLGRMSVLPRRLRRENADVNDRCSICIECGDRVYEPALDDGLGMSGDGPR